MPAAIPATTPLVVTVPFAGFVLLHVPPPVPLADNDVVAPTQTTGVPLMVPGVANGLTVTICVAATAPQPFVTVYEIVVVPPEIPATTPLVDTVPTVVFVLLHVPPPVPLADSVVVAPTHTVGLPLIVPGEANGFTVTVAVALQPEPVE